MRFPLNGGKSNWVLTTGRVKSSSSASHMLGRARVLIQRASYGPRTRYLSRWSSPALAVLYALTGCLFWTCLCLYRATPAGIEPGSIFVPVSVYVGVHKETQLGLFPPYSLAHGLGQEIQPKQQLISCLALYLGTFQSLSSSQSCLTVTRTQPWHTELKDPFFP